MANKVYQVRYYGDGSTNNYPAGLTGNKLRSGSIFNSFTPMKQIGIQTIPGVKFYLNNAYEPILIGSTGTYELSAENLTEITSLSFDVTSINLINSPSSTAYIIVDVLYED